MHSPIVKGIFNKTKGCAMVNITTLESKVVANCCNNYRSFLFTQLKLVEQHFNWLNLTINDKVIVGSGLLQIGSQRYNVKVSYSPFFSFRFDRIYIQGIKYHKKIHVYSDLSLCLYHPIIDMPLLKTVSLLEIIPWITEWCVHYQEWQKYGVWLGKEINHD